MWKTKLRKVGTQLCSGEKKIMIEIEIKKKGPSGKEFKERKKAGLYFYGVVLLAEFCRNQKRRFQKMQNIIKRL